MTSSPVFRILVLVLLVFAGWKFFEFQRQKGWKEYLVYFEDVEGIQPASKVMIQGVPVGKIQAIDLVDPHRIRISLYIDAEQEIREGALAYLANDGVNGEKRIDIIQGEGSGTLEPGSILGSRLDSNLLPLNHRISPMLETARFLLASSEAGLRGFHYALNSGLLQGAARSLLNMEDQLLDWEMRTDKAWDRSGRWAKDMQASTSSLNRLGQSLEEDPLRKVLDQTDSLVRSGEALTREWKSSHGLWTRKLKDWEKKKPELRPWLKEKDNYHRLQTQIRKFQESLKTLEDTAGDPESRKTAPGESSIIPH